MAGAELALQPSARRRPQTASALGARIRALPADQLDGFAVYRTPAPLQRQTVTAGRGTYTERLVDPEDNPATLEPEPASSRRS